MQFERIIVLSSHSGWGPICVCDHVLVWLLILVGHYIPPLHVNRAYNRVFASTLAVAVHIIVAADNLLVAVDASRLPASPSRILPFLVSV